MNPSQTLWSRLRAAGAVTGEAPVRNEGLPWYLAGLIGVSAWIAAGLLFGFFATQFDRIWTSPRYAVMAGAPCIAAALALLRIARGREFFEQAAIALSLAGQLLVGIGVNGRFGDTAGWAGSAALALVLYVSGAQAMHRFLCGAVFAGALVAVCNELDAGSYGPSPVVLPMLAWLAFAAWWRTAHEDSRMLPLSPMAWALSLAALLMAFIGDAPWEPSQQTGMSIQNWVARSAVALLLPLTAWRLAGVRQWLPLLCATAFALIWLRAPGVSLGMMLALTAFASHRPALLATGLLGTGAYLIVYYHQLDVTLLEKSWWLLLGGVALLLIRVVLNRVVPMRGARGARA